MLEAAAAAAAAAEEKEEVGRGCRGGERRRRGRMRPFAEEKDEIYCCVPSELIYYSCQMTQGARAPAVGEWLNLRALSRAGEPQNSQHLSWNAHKHGAGERLVMLGTVLFYFGTVILLYVRYRRSVLNSRLQTKSKAVFDCVPV